jgi:hypothetical protein
VGVAVVDTRVRLQVLVVRVVVRVVQVPQQLELLIQVVAAGELVAVQQPVELVARALLF